MDKDGYPDDAELEQIRTWDVKDSLGLVEFLCERWRYSEYFTFDPSAGTLELHTAGWSGNEDLVSALHANTLFWTLYWQMDKRGGHYYFDDHMVSKDLKWAK